MKESVPPLANDAHNGAENDARSSHNAPPAHNETEGREPLGDGRTTPAEAKAVLDTVVEKHSAAESHHEGEGHSAEGGDHHAETHSTEDGHGAEHKEHGPGGHTEEHSSDSHGGHHGPSRFEKAMGQAGKILAFPPKAYTKWVGLPAGAVLAVPGAGWAVGNVYGGAMALLGHPGHFALAAKAGALFHFVLPVAGPLFAPLAAVGLMAAMPFIFPNFVSFVTDKIMQLSNGKFDLGSSGHTKSHKSHDSGHAKAAHGPAHH